ncbi:MAG: hypothetical protein K1X79_06630 [Oligoflexia bacterium]|nr:hypothetical protein [Oligoflexia bacterium]
MKRSLITLAALFFLVLGTIQSAHAQDLQCEIIFAGTSAAASAQTQGITGTAVLLIGFGGYIQCRSPAAAGWNSFADRSADQRYISLSLPTAGFAGATPERMAILEARLKDCYRQALIAMNNPARLMLELSVRPARYNDDPGPHTLSMSIWVDTADTISCTLTVNNSGLR